MCIRDSLALLCVFGGCGGVAGEKPPPLAISVVSGDQQMGIVGKPLPAPLVVEAMALGGEPLANITINFAATNGTVSAPTALTDALGRAQITLELGELAGSAIVD